MTVETLFRCEKCRRDFPACRVVGFRKEDTAALEDGLYASRTDMARYPYHMCHACACAALNRYAGIRQPLFDRT